MTTYLYDGTFEGLLAVVDECFSQGIVPGDIVPVCADTPCLFGTAKEVAPSAERLCDFVAKIRKEAALESIRKVFYVYLSEKRQHGMMVYRYLDFALRHGRQTDFFLSEDAVAQVEKLFLKVRREAHRMLGLVRFKELEQGGFYAQIGPDHNILPLISSHFVRRMRHDPWVIHDVVRRRAAVYRSGRCQVVDIRLEREPVFTEEEYFYQDMWRKYFETIAIEERKNPKLQRQCLPQRYWAYLVE